MSMRIVFLIAKIALFMACSANDSTRDKGTDIPDTGFKEDPIAEVSFTLNFFAKDLRFSAYSFSAKRASLIDPSSEKEIWGEFTNRDFTQSLSLAEIEGVGLLRDGEFYITSPNGSRSFALQSGSFQRWRKAKDALAFAFVDSNEKTLQVIRQYNSVEWQDSIFDIPAKMEAESGYLFPIFSADGTTLFLFNPVSVSYLVYRAGNGNEEMQETKLVCYDADGIEDTADNAYRTAAITPDNKFALLGKENGTMHLVSLENSCVASGSFSVFNTQSNNPLTRTDFLSENELWTVHEKGIVDIYNYTFGNITYSKSYPDICKFPVSLHELNNRNFILACVPISPQTIYDNELSGVDLFTFAKKDAKVKSEINFSDEEVVSNLTTSVSLDGENEKLFQFLNTGSGGMKVFDLNDGSSRNIEGLYLEGLLNRL